MHDPFLRQDDKMARLEDAKITLFDNLQDLWENTEEARDLWYEIRSGVRQILKIHSELK